MSGKITTNGYIVEGATSDGYLKADGSVDYESTPFIIKTLAEILDLINNDSLIKGSLYKITGVHTSLYNDGTNLGTSIYLHALTNKTLSKQGYGEFFNVKYDREIDGFGIWHVGGIYATNSNTIWGGYSWKNLTGNVGTALDCLRLDTVNWVKNPHDLNNYNKVFDIIEYDIANDWISRRYESETDNDVIYTYQDHILLAEGVSVGSRSAISVFMFGNKFDLGYMTSGGVDIIKGLKNNKVFHSYFECINFREEGIICNELIDSVFKLFNDSYMNRTIRYNKLENVSIDTDLSSAILIYENFNKKIYSRPDGTPKITYFNNSDTIVIADITD